MIVAILDYLQEVTMDDVESSAFAFIAKPSGVSLLLLLVIVSAIIIVTRI